MIFTNKTNLRQNLEARKETRWINVSLDNFYVSVRSKDGSFYNLKTSLLSVPAALNHHQNSTPHNKKFSSATTVYLFSEANRGLDSYLKQLTVSPKAIYKKLLTSKATYKKLYDKVLSLTLSYDPQVLHQRAWFISICISKWVTETQHSFTEVNASSQWSGS